MIGVINCVESNNCFFNFFRVRKQIASTLQSLFCSSNLIWEQKTSLFLSLLVVSYYIVLLQDITFYSQIKSDTDEQQNI